MAEEGTRNARQKVPAIFSDPAAVEAAVNQAKQTAAEKKVPLTLSRLADCLGVEEEALNTFLEGGGRSGSIRESRRLLRLARQGCRADLMEAMMDKGYNGAGVILVGKHDFGLEEKPSGPVTVVFTGADKL